MMKTHKRKKLLIFATSILLISTTLFIVFSISSDQNSSRGFVKLNIQPLFQNDNYSCATTSLAMVLSFYEKKEFDLKRIWKISGYKEADVSQFGNSMSGLKKVADFYDYKSGFKENMNIKEIEELLSSGTPIILNILQKKRETPTHAVLVIGYDSKKSILYVNDPAKTVTGDSLSYEDLTVIWQASLSDPRKISYKSAFILYPKDQ